MKAAADGDVLFLHSFGLDGASASWLDLPRVNAPTLPNHGGRRRQRQGLSIEDVVDEIVGWLPGPVHVIGCSVGGILALHLALGHPHLVRSLVLACTAAWVPRDVIRARAHDTERLPAAEVTQSTLNRWFSKQALAHPSPSVQYAIERLQESNRSALADFWRIVAEHDVRDRLHEIRMPTTIIGGEQDISAPIERSHELSRGIEHARFVELNAPHMAYLEDPAGFTRAPEEHFAHIQSGGHQ